MVWQPLEGHDPSTEDEGDEESEVSCQEDCLQLTLESGLEILGGLKDLRGINVAHMEHGMGIAEVQWMVKSWLKLKSIFGLKEDSEAYLWLKENHPELTKPIWYKLDYYKEEGDGGSEDEKDAEYAQDAGDGEEESE